MFPQHEVISLNTHLHAFPDAGTVFSVTQPWLKEHFLPLISIDLSALNPDWTGTTLHMLNPFEPFEGLIGEDTEEHHNEFTSANWLAFRLNAENQYEFLGNEGYFLSAPINQGKSVDGDLQAQVVEMRASYAKAKQQFHETGKLITDDCGEQAYLDTLGGEMTYGNWPETAEIPTAFSMQLPPYGTSYEELDKLPNSGISITFQGKPFYFIATVAGYNWCEQGADAIILLFEPVSRTVLFTFDWS